MLKIAVQQFKKKWYFSLAPFIAILVSISLFMPFIILEGNSISHLIKTGEEDALIIFNIFIGLVMGMTVIVLSSTISFSIKRKWSEIVALRIIGATSKQVKQIVYIELSIVSLIAITIATPLGVLLVDPITDFMISNNALAPSFIPEKNALFIFIGIIVTMIIILINALIAIAAIRKINISTSNSVKTTSRKMKITFIVISCVSFLLSLGLFATGHLMNGGMGTMMYGFSCLLFLISIALSGKYVVELLITLLSRLFKKSPKMYVALNSSKHGVKTLFHSVILIASIFMIINYSMSVNPIMNKANNYWTTQISKNVNSRYENYSQTNIQTTESDWNSIYYNNPSVNVEANWDDARIDSGSYPKFMTYSAIAGTQDFIYDYKTIKGNVDDIFSKTNAMISVGSGYSVGDVVKVGFPKDDNDTNIIYNDFEIVAVVEKPIYYSVFPDYYINFEGIADTGYIPHITNVISTSNDVTGLPSNFIKVDPNQAMILQQDIQNAMITLSIIILGMYAIISITNSVVFYLIDRKKVNRTLRIVSYTQKQIVFNNFIESLVIATTGLLLSMPIAVVFNILYSMANHIPIIAAVNPISFVLVGVILFVLVLTVSFVTSLFISKNLIPSDKK